MFKKIPGNAQEDSGECSKRKDSEECSKRFRGMLKKIPKRFRGMFQKIPGNAQEDSGECSKRGMLENIPGNVRKDSGESKFKFILRNLAYFLSNSAIKWRQNKGIFSMLLLTTYN